MISVEITWGVWTSTPASSNETAFLYLHVMLVSEKGYLRISTCVTNKKASLFLVLVEASWEAIRHSYLSQPEKYQWRLSAELEFLSSPSSIEESLPHSGCTST